MHTQQIQDLICATLRKQGQSELSVRPSVCQLQSVLVLMIDPGIRHQEELDLLQEIIKDAWLDIFDEVLKEDKEDEEKAEVIRLYRSILIDKYANKEIIIAQPKQPKPITHMTLCDLIQGIITEHNCTRQNHWDAMKSATGTSQCMCAINLIQKRPSGTSDFQPTEYEMKFLALMAKPDWETRFTKEQLFDDTEGVPYLKKQRRDVLLKYAGTLADIEPCGTSLFLLEQIIEQTKSTQKETPVVSAAATLQELIHIRITPFFAAELKAMIEKQTSEATTQPNTLYETLQPFLPSLLPTVASHN